MLLTENLINKYRSFMQERGMSYNTIISYTQVIKHFLLWYKHINNRQLDLLNYDRSIAQQYQLYLETEKSNARSTIKHKVSCINNFLSFLAVTGVGVNYKIRYADTGHKGNETNALSYEEMNRLYDAAELSGNLRDLALFCLMLNTDIKLNEICAIKKSDVHEENGVTVIKINSRNIVLNSRAADILKTYLDDYRRDDQIPYLFIGEKSKNKMSRITIHHVAKAYSDKLNIPINYRILNQTFIVACANALNTVNTKGLRTYIKELNQDPQQAKKIYDKLYQNYVEKNEFWS